MRRKRKACPAVGAAGQAERKRMAAANTAYDERSEKLDKNCGFELDGLLRATISGTEVPDEGRALKHCVGRYADRHVQGYTTKTVEVVAAEINSLTESMLVNIVEIGRRMCEAKEMLPYGTFGT